jgi:hypothetical protein
LDKAEHPIKEDESLEDESSQDSLGSAEANNSHSCGSDLSKVSSVCKLYFIMSEISCSALCQDW